MGKCKEIEGYPADRVGDKYERGLCLRFFIVLLPISFVRFLLLKESNECVYASSRTYAFTSDVLACKMSARDSHSESAVRTQSNPARWRCRLAAPMNSESSNTETYRDKVSKKFLLFSDESTGGRGSFALSSWSIKYGTSLRQSGSGTFSKNILFSSFAYAPDNSTYGQKSLSSSHASRIFLFTLSMASLKQSTTILKSVKEGGFSPASRAFEESANTFRSKSVATGANSCSSTSASDVSTRFGIPVNAFPHLLIWFSSSRLIFSMNAASFFSIVDSSPPDAAAEEKRANASSTRIINADDGTPASLNAFSINFLDELVL